MEYKQFSTDGNDCKIFKTVSLIPVGSMWVITVLTNCLGGYIEKNNLSTETIKFDSYSRALQCYEAIEY